MTTALTEQTVALLTARSTSRDTWVGLRMRNYDKVVARVIAGKVDRAEMESSTEGHELVTFSGREEARSSSRLPASWRCCAMLVRRVGRRVQQRSATRTVIRCRASRCW